MTSCQFLDRSLTVSGDKRAVDRLQPSWTQNDTESQARSSKAGMNTHKHARHSEHTNGAKSNATATKNTTKPRVDRCSKRGDATHGLKAVSSKRHTTPFHIANAYTGVVTVRMLSSTQIIHCCRLMLYLLLQLLHRSHTSYTLLKQYHQCSVVFRSCPTGKSRAPLKIKNIKHTPKKNSTLGKLGYSGPENTRPNHCCTAIISVLESGAFILYHKSVMGIER